MRTRKANVADAARRRAAEVVGEGDGAKQPAAPRAVEAAGQEPEKAATKPRRRRAAPAKAAEEPALPGMGEVADDVEAEADRKEQAARAQRETATVDPSELSMGEGYDRIVETLFDMPEPHETYLAVKRALRLGTKASRASYGDLVDALDQAQEMADRAYDLAVNAKTAQLDYDIDAKAIEAGMREEAMAALMKEYKAGQRKSPTNDDIEAYMAAKFPDEWRDIQARRGRARRTVRKLENLAVRAHERARDLRQMVSTARG